MSTEEYRVLISERQLEVLDAQRQAAEAQTAFWEAHQGKIAEVFELLNELLGSEAASEPAVGVEEDQATEGLTLDGLRHPLVVAIEEHVAACGGDLETTGEVFDASIKQIIRAADALAMGPYASIRRGGMSDEA